MPALTSTIIDDIIHAFNQHDVEKVLNYFSNNGIMISSGGDNCRGTYIQGKEAIGMALRSRFSSCPDINWSECKTWISGHKAVSEFRVKATLPTGKKLDAIGCDIWEFSEGKIMRKDTYYKHT
ncbi:MULTISPECIES: nuclear transport factor 2 family protein [Pseudomonas]|uniref:nuclear transport factor 2 family protein n=1 Tax=Pseudomonas TaxID=286 RepID=UPI0009B62941|nr:MULTISPECIES: nuclear transport factor 2 family protein [Pseudomonas]WOB61212.1 nuclear transport factor 2 family protein [Pseudomonas sp. NBB]